MRDKRIVSRDSETHRYDQLADGFQVLAEKQLTRIDRFTTIVSSFLHYASLSSSVRYWGASAFTFSMNATCEATEDEISPRRNDLLRSMVAPTKGSVTGPSAREPFDETDWNRPLRPMA